MIGDDWHIMAEASQALAVSCKCVVSATACVVTVHLHVDSYGPGHHALDDAASVNASGAAPLFSGLDIALEIASTPEAKPAATLSVT
mmetsp:Transcript_58643/g.136926  ORF Transcript_58643/g.136926 Transcript_58643/m.136926 type:complete len:87 (-) Transcript_58643:738-998(-)